MSFPAGFSAALLLLSLAESESRNISRTPGFEEKSLKGYWFVTAENEGWAVAEVVKTFGNSSEAETLDEFRYPAV